MTLITKDGDSFSIITDAVNDYVFIDEISEVLERMIDGGDFSGDWHFQFCYLLPLISQQINSINKIEYVPSMKVAGYIGGNATIYK